MRRATSETSGRRGLIWLVMDVRDAGPADPFRYSVDVIILDSLPGTRCVYYGRQYWRIGSLEDPAYVLAPGVEAPAGLELEPAALSALELERLELVESWSLKIHGKSSPRHAWIMVAALALVDGDELPAAGPGTAFHLRSTAAGRVTTIRRLLELEPVTS